MKEPVHLLCAVNAGYIMPLCVMLASLVTHLDSKRSLVLHLMGGGISEKDRDQVRQSLLMNRENLEKITLHWYAIDRSHFGELPIADSRFGLETYMRLLAPLLLPTDVPRVLYLDCDIVVLEDISALYDSANDAVVHAVHDISTPFVSSSAGVFDYVERGIPPQTRYFNSGVLLIDLRQWRDRNLTASILAYLTENAGRTHLHDQGGLNAFLCRDWAPLDPTWNQGFDILCPELWQAAGYSRAEWQQARNHPRLIHFSGPTKPWPSGRRGPRY